MNDLSKEIQYVKGVGPAKAKALKTLGISTLKDLVTYYPRGYEDRSIIKKLNEVNDEDKVCIEVRALTNCVVRMLGRTRSIEKLVVTDETDNMTITWFNQPYLSRQIKQGEMYRFYGKVSKKGNTLGMNSPVFDQINKDKIDHYIQEGLMLWSKDQTSLYLSYSGMMILDTILLELIK